MKHIKRAFRGVKNKIAGRDGAQNQQPQDGGGVEVIPSNDLRSVEQTKDAIEYLNSG
jgi:hypothetical protein